jgi:hypothetical protein
MQEWFKVGGLLHGYESKTNQTWLYFLILLIFDGKVVEIKKKTFPVSVECFTSRL